MYAIVVIGYNRDKSLDRLLHSLSRAYYYGDKVDLIISIDKSNNEKVKQVAEEYNWNNGEKKLKIYKEKQGLKNHILSCGNYLDQYEAIAVLEDDLMVSPYFYQYMREAVTFYGNDEDIAGISLYNHNWNVIANMPFQSMKGNDDTYFMQFAQSWGQIWLRKTWKDFYDWYRVNTLIFEEKSEKPFPQVVSNWSESSWLKYHIKYCVEKNKFFVYPYQSLTTNFTESGTHNKKNITRFQVPMLYTEKDQYHFATLQRGIKYDVFFENMNLQEKLEQQYPGIAVDLYGCKSGKSKYLLTTQILNYEIVKNYGLELRPQEVNIIENTQGQDIYLYDMTIRKRHPIKKNIEIVKRWNYHFRERFLMWNEILPVAIEKVVNLISEH